MDVQIGSTKLTRGCHVKSSKDWTENTSETSSEIVTVKMDCVKNSLPTGWKRKLNP